MRRFEILIASTVVLVFVLFQTEQISAQQLPPLITLGRINNRTLFTTGNSSFESNWFDAKGICNGWGLEFGMLKSDEEFDFLRSLLPGNTAQLWIDVSIYGVNEFNARPAFVNGDGSDFTSKNFMLMPANFLCAYFSADDHVFVDSCITGSHGLLCQTS